MTHRRKHESRHSCEWRPRAACPHYNVRHRLATAEKAPIPIAGVQVVACWCVRSGHAFTTAARAGFGQARYAKHFMGDQRTCGLLGLSAL